MKTKPAILIYGPDCDSTQLLKKSLEQETVEVKLCSEIECAYSYYRDENPIICILHEFSSQESSFPLAKRMLDLSRKTYLIFIFKQDKMINFRLGYQLGADDCLMIPYDIDELKLRLKAMVRRQIEKNHKPLMQFTLGEYIFDAQKGVLCLTDSKIHLTSREADLLLLLCRRMNKTVSKDDALKTIWSDGDVITPHSRILSIYIFKLRQILKNDPSVQIVTLHREGYKLMVNQPIIIPDVISYQYFRV